MALLYTDGFAADNIGSKWNAATTTTTATTIPRFTGDRYYSSGNNGRITKYITPSTQVTVGFAMAMGADANGGLQLLADTHAVAHITVVANLTNSFLEVRRGTNSGTILATGTTQLRTNCWYYVEVQATIADSGGQVTVRVNGVTDVSFTGDTRNAGTSTNIDAVVVGTFNTVSVGIDDVYILNNTGTTNTSFLGDIRVYSLSPSADGASSQLVGSDGDSLANWQQVDELPVVTADYNGSPTTGLKDSYTMGNLPANINQVFGVQTNIVAAKSDATAGSSRAYLTIASTDYPGATQPLTTTYTNYLDIYDQNPNTVTAWTTSDVNSLETGMEVM